MEVGHYPNEKHYRISGNTNARFIFFLWNTMNIIKFLYNYYRNKI